MPEDQKKTTAGQAPCQDSNPTGGQKRVRAKAPDQDALPGILGKQLRAAYGELLNAPIPDAFADLIKQLEDQEPGARSDQSSKPPRPEEGDQ